jgi:CHAT domain-containing protein
MGFADDIIAIRRDLTRIAIEHKERPLGESRDDLLHRATTVEKEARRLRNSQLIAVSLLQSVELLLAVDRVREALALLQQVKKDLGELRQADLQVRALGYFADAYGRLAEWKRVSAVCDEGIALVEAYRYKLSADYLASAYLRSRVGLYSWAVRAACELKHYERAIECAELSKCRVIISKGPRSGRAPSPENAGREREFRDLCRQIAACPAGAAPEHLVARRAVLWDLMNIGSSDPPSTDFDLRVIQSLLSSEEAILYYYWVDPHSLVIATIAHDGFGVELRHISDEQRGMLETYARNALKSRPEDLDLNAFEPVSGFGSFLLPGVSSVAWQSKQHLIISPHRVLHSIPFHAMRFQNRWLIERAAISYTPNLGCLQRPYTASKTQRVLVVGIEHFDVPGKLLPPLPDTQLEAQEVKEVYEAQGVPVTSLPEAEATIERLRSLERDGVLKGYSCLHFATHGENVNDDNPMEARFYMQDSVLDGLELADLQLGAETVVLSACSSGQRPIRGRGLEELPGDDLFGLQAALFRAGVRRVIGTLWIVDSSAARRISRGFHAHLAADKNCRAEVALQASVNDYLSQANVHRRRIYYWAPFFLSVFGRSE